MAIAGLGGPGVEYFAPAAGIRALAILRTGGRYGERLVTHEATFRLIARLRAGFYEHLEPLAPARLQHYRGGDLLSRQGRRGQGGRLHPSPRSRRRDVQSSSRALMRASAPSPLGW